jgi:hypothetical protein
VRPTKVKDLIPEVAEYLNIPEEHLKVIMNFYNKGNKQILSELLYPFVKIRGLGVMVQRGWDLNKTIGYKKQDIKAESDSRRRSKLREELQVLLNARDRWTEHVEQRTQFRENKKELKLKKNESQGKTPGSMG